MPEINVTVHQTMQNNTIEKSVGGGGGGQKKRRKSKYSSNFVPPVFGPRPSKLNGLVFSPALRAPLNIVVRATSGRLAQAELPLHPVRAPRASGFNATDWETAEGSYPPRWYPDSGCCPETWRSGIHPLSADEVFMCGVPPQPFERGRP